MNGKRTGARSASKKSSANHSTARTTIAVQGARVHNLKNVTLEIPRDKLVVVTGLSGSRKVEPAFDTIYAEGQRRYMESLSTYAKRFVAQVTKPDVDFVFGLSPVISIEQKTIANNPRVHSRNDDRHRELSQSALRHDRVRLIVRARVSRHRIVLRCRYSKPFSRFPKDRRLSCERLSSRCTAKSLTFVFTELRKKGCRQLLIDGKNVDIFRDRSRSTNRKCARSTLSLIDS